MKNALFLLKLWALISFFSINIFAWDTKEAFDKDFREAASKFLSSRGQKIFLIKNFPEFVNTHIPLLKEYNKFCTYNKNDANNPWSGVMSEMDSFSSAGFDAYEGFFCIGPRKPLGNFPLRGTMPLTEEIQSAIKNWATTMEYMTYIGSAPSQWEGLWVYSPNVLAKMLDAHSVLLNENKINKDPLEFIKAINGRGADDTPPFGLQKGNHQMYQLIARAFGRDMSLEEIEKLFEDSIEK